MGTIDLSGRHPSTAEKLRWFEHAHLPQPLGSVAAYFAQLADALVRDIPDHPQLTLALQHLLEAEDAAVRATIAATTDRGALVPNSRPVPERYGATLEPDRQSEQAYELTQRPPYTTEHGGLGSTPAGYESAGED